MSATVEQSLGEKVSCSICGTEVLQSELPAHTTLHSNEIFPHLYLGAQRNVSNKEELTQRTKVTDILNLTEDVENYFEKCPRGCPCSSGHTSPNCLAHSSQASDAESSSESWFSYSNFKILDKEGENIAPIFEEVFQLIEKVRQKNNGKIMVHCFHGISRSASIVIAYVMKYKQWSLKKAFDHVREQRPLIKPNPFFLQQLQGYEKHLMEVEHLTLEGYPAPQDSYHGPSLTLQDVQNLVPQNHH